MITKESILGYVKHKYEVAENFRIIDFYIENEILIYYYYTTSNYTDKNGCGKDVISVDNYKNWLIINRSKKINEII